MEVSLRLNWRNLKRLHSKRGTSQTCRKIQCNFTTQWCILKMCLLQSKTKLIMKKTILSFTNSSFVHILCRCNKPTIKHTKRSPLNSCQKKKPLARQVKHLKQYLQVNQNMVQKTLSTPYQTFQWPRVILKNTIYKFVNE